MENIVFVEKSTIVKKEKHVLQKDAKIEITDCKNIEIKNSPNGFQISFHLKNEPHLIEIKNTESLSIQTEENNKFIITRMECNIEYEVYPINPENTNESSISTDS